MSADRSIKAFVQTAVTNGMTLKQARDEFELQLTQQRVMLAGGVIAKAAASLGERRTSTLRRLNRGAKRNQHQALE